MADSDICAKCKKDLGYGDLIDYDGKTYHSECFLCESCNKPFPDGKIVKLTKDGKSSIICEPCHRINQEKNGEFCEACKKPLSGSILSALEKKYHAACFVCSTCRNPFPNNRFIVDGSKMNCESCSKLGSGMAPPPVAAPVAAPTPAPAATIVPTVVPQIVPNSAKKELPHITTTTASGAPHVGHLSVATGSSSNSYMNPPMPSTPSAAQKRSTSVSGANNHPTAPFSPSVDSANESAAKQMSFEEQAVKSRNEATSGVARMQKKSYTVWCNVHLAQRGLQIDDLYTDFEDGVNLINLIEVISGYKVKIARYNKAPKMEVHRQENLKQALEAIRSEGIKLVNIGALDIMTHNERIILGLVWTLILRYQIQEGRDANDVGGAKAALLKWVREQIAETYPNIVLPENFHASFQDGTVMASLIHKFAPEKTFDHGNVTPNNAMSNATNAFQVGKDQMDIPRLMEPEDLVMQKPDENTVMTYCSFIQRYAAQREARKNLNPQHYSLKAVDSVICGHPFAAEIKISKDASGGATHELFEAYILSSFTDSNNAQQTMKIPAKVQPQRANQMASFSIDCLLLHHNAVNNLHVKLNGNEIHDSPHKINGQLGKSCDVISSILPGCKPTGKNSNRANSMIISTLTVRLADICGNMMNRGNDKIVAELHSLDRGTVSPCDVTDNKDGSYKITFVPPAPGNYKMRTGMQYNSLPALTQHKEARETLLTTFKQLAFPINDNLMQETLNLLSTNPSNQQLFSPNVSTPESQLTMKIDEFPINVLGGASATNSTVEGNGLRHATAGEPATFTLTTFDEMNQRLEQGGVGNSIAIEGLPLMKPAVIQDNNDGTYVITYIPTLSGENNLVVKIGSEPLKNCPFKVAVSPGATDAKSCTAAGVGLTGDVGVKIPTSFQITARDAFGNLRGVGGDVFEVDPQNGKLENVRVTDNGNGTYQAEYTPTSTGPVSIIAAKDKVLIKDMPVHVNVLSASEIAARHRRLMDLITELRAHRDGLQDAVDNHQATTCDCDSKTTTTCPSCKSSFTIREWLIKKFGANYSVV